MEWEAYDRLDPIGEWRADFRMAKIISENVNVALSKTGKKNIKLTAPGDYMPDWDFTAPKPPPKTQSVEEMKEIILSMASSLKDNKKIREEVIPKPPKNGTI